MRNAAIVVFLVSVLSVSVTMDLASADITYREREVKPFRMYYHDEDAGTTSEISTTGGNYEDYFYDNATVNDSLYLTAYRTTENKYSGLRFEIDTPVNATNFSVVWEYPHRTGADWQYDLVWLPLENVSDGCANFTQTGTCYVNWTVPYYWDNYVYPGGNTGYYSWFVRARVLNATGLTEGGNQSADFIYTVQDMIFVETDTYNDSMSPLNMSQIFDYDQANGWGCMSHLNRSNHYLFDCSLYIDTGNYLESKEETIEFMRNWDLFNYAYSSFGELYSGDMTKGSGTIIFNVCNGDYDGTILYHESTMYNYDVVHHYLQEDYCAYHGHWGGFIGEGDYQKIYNNFYSGFRQLAMMDRTNVVMGVKGYLGHIEPPGAVLKDIIMYGGDFGIRTTSYSNNSYVHEFDFSGVSIAGINPYYYNTDDLHFYVVDSFWGELVNDEKVYWNRPGTDNIIYNVNSVLLRIVDKDGSPVSGANVTIRNSEWELVFSGTTNADGYASDDIGTVTGGNESEITDSSKSWSTDELYFKEIYITSGNAAGQRRIVMKGNDNETLPLAWDLVINISPGDRFVKIPYLTTSELQPRTEEYDGSCYSNYTSYNPFNIEIVADNYISKNFTINITEKTEWTIVLEQPPTVIDGTLVLDSSQNTLLIRKCAQLSLLALFMAGLLVARRRD